MIDAAWRTAFRIGFPLARLWWWVWRPAHQGALVAVWHAGRVLVVRQSYRRVLGFPGGGVRRNEDPRVAASRELGEELGLAVDPAALVLAWEQVAEWDFRRDHIRIFELVLTEPPRLRPDRREVIEAAFHATEDLLAGPLSPCVIDYTRATRGAPLGGRVDGVSGP